MQNLDLVEIPCNFVGSFKVGDNISYNVDILTELCKANEEDRFNKVIVCQVGSILEACLSEVISRAQNFNREGVISITEEDRSEISLKKIDKFNTVIDIMKKYHILDKLGSDIYDELHRIRKYRNKIHIQDDINIGGVPRDEIEPFTAEIFKWSLNLNFRVVKFLSEELLRPKHQSYVQPLKIPVLIKSA